MADESLEIVIRSKGGEQVVAQFKAVSTGAQQMGVTTEAAAKKAGASLKDMGKDSDDLNRRMAAMGAAITTGAAILGQWSRSAQDAAAIQRQLEASIAATGESFETYAAQIEEVGARAVQLGQDDEAASQAISALTQITGSASVAINEMGLVFDLAAAKGMSLESAAELVGKVHEGNTAILQRYGIVVREGATAEEALGQIQQQVAGQAEAHATTYARLREELSNVTDAIGGAVGGFAPMLALLPGVSAGFTLAGSAIGAIAPNLTKAGLATSALSLAMGPVGLALAAGAATTAVVVLAEHLGSDYGNAVRDAEKATSSLVDTINALLAAGDATGLIGAEMRATFVSIGASTSDLGSAIDALEDAMRHTQIQENLTGPDVQPQLDAMQASLDQLKAIEEQFGSSKDAAREYGETMAALDAIFAHAGPGQEEILRQAQLLSDQLKKDGIAGLQAYENAMQDLAASMAEYDAAAVKASEATTTFSEVFGRLVSVGEDWEHLNVMTLLDWAKNSDTAADSLGNLAKRASEGADAITDTVQAKYDDIYATQLLTAANDENAGSLNNLFQASLENGKAMTEHAEAAKAAADASLLWRVEAQEGASTLGTLAAQASAGDAAMGGLTGSIQAVTSASQRMALGIGTAGDALATFKDIQDGVIAQGDVFNQQFSEYGSQISNIERAQKILNDRRAEGQQLSKDELAFLDDAVPALERLNAGQEDAAISAGELAVKYGENMSTGDRLNETLNGTNSAVTGLTGAVTALVLALAGLPGTTGTEVTLTGALEGYDQTTALHDALDELDGTAVGADVFVGLSGLSESGIRGIGNALAAIDGTVATAVVNVVTGNTSGLSAGNIFGMHGGVLGYANGGMTQAVLAEAGYEHLRFANGGSAIAMTPGLYTVPVGTFVTPHPETAAKMGQSGGGGGFTFNNYGPIHGFSDLDAFFAAGAEAAKRHLGGGF
jgi:hypothetical protein